MKEYYEGLLRPLREIANRMNGQDNRATAHPVFQVRDKRRILGLDPQWGGPIVWTFDDYVFEDPDNDEDFVKAKEYYNEHAREPDGWCRTSYVEVEVVIQSFFSEKAAEEYLQQNKHNLEKPFVYVDSAYRNKEWQDIQNVLLRLKEEELP